MDVAATAAVLREKVEKLNTTIETLRSQGAGQIADPQSLVLAMIFRVEQDLVRVGLAILLALAIESVCCFGLLVIVGGHPGETAGKNITVGEWFGRWLSEQAEPVPAVRTSFAELEADFRRWAAGQIVPQLSSRGFARLLRVACDEVGLAIEGQAVIGLQLCGNTKLIPNCQTADETEGPLCEQLDRTGHGDRHDDRRGHSAWHQAAEKPAKAQEDA
jgi:hypothetical protein